jgi:hypothetical protein
LKQQESDSVRKPCEPPKQRLACVRPDDADAVAGLELAADSKGNEGGVAADDVVSAGGLDLAAPRFALVQPREACGFEAGRCIGDREVWIGR